MNRTRTGYDCPGFVRYAFAGVLLPKYLAIKNNAGCHVGAVVSQARRSDLHGPDGSQHVTIYLGNGQMLESSPWRAAAAVLVCTAGATPYLTRIIEIRTGLSARRGDAGD